jgi:hypothetical protein
VRRSLVVLVVLLAACTGGDDDGDHPSSEPSTTTTPTTTTVPLPTPEELSAAMCAAEPVPVRARIRDPRAIELSGLAEAAGTLWSHNDSGDTARVLALDPRGGILAEATVEGAEAVDWEDIASDGSELYVGDIGDNQRVRPEITVYRFPPPTELGHVTVPAADVQAITLHYPNGPRDAEALLVDPVTHDLVIAHKRFGGRSEVYVAPEDDWSDGDATLQRVGTFLPGNTPLDAVTSGEVSADGQLVGIRTYARVLVFPRDEGQSVAEAIIDNQPCEAPTAVELQGEAFTFTAEGYVTVSEGERPVLHRFRSAPA